jgi:RNA polymerase sigma-70 factor (ECF subfamily)
VTRAGAADGLDPDLRFEALFEAHFDGVYRYCLRRLGKADAEDATAEVFAVAWRRMRAMPDGDTERAWLYGVAYRVIGNQYRGRKRRRDLKTRMALATPDGPNQGDGIDSGLERILVALGRLSRSDQELLRLSAWDGLGRAEIASVLGIKENAVDQRLFRARARLRARFEQVAAASLDVTHEEAPT